MNLKKKDIGMYRHQIESEIGKDATGKEVLDYLYGSYQNGYDTDFKVVKRWYSSDTTVKNRLNMLWAFPLTIICAPFQFVAYGQVGWEEDGKVGGFILSCVCQNRNDKE